MKSLFFLSVALAADAAVLGRSEIHTHEKRQMQIGAGLFSFIWSSRSKVPKASVQSKTLKAEIFPTASRQRLTWGPFTLQPATGTHKAGGLKLDQQSDVLEEALAGVCKDCMVLQAKAEITDKEGNRLDLKEQVYTHHIIVANLGRMMVMPPVLPSFSGFAGCAGAAKGSGSMGGMGGMAMGAPKAATTPAATPAKSPSKRSPQSPAKSSGSSGMSGFSIFIGKGNEGDSSIFAPINSTAIKSGYWIGRDDKITATAEVVNYKNVPQDIYLSIDMEYLPINGTRPTEYLDVGFGALQIEQCGNMYLHPPKDKGITFSSSEQSVMGNGYLINLSPHLHDGALNMKVYLNGKVVCQSDAIYGQDGGTSVNGEKWETITSYTPCLDPVKIKYGDKIKMTSDYDLTKHKLRPDSKEAGAEAEAMAIANFQFAQLK